MRAWCGNFDGDAGPLGKEPREYALRHGLAESMWLMQYQYPYKGHTYQGGQPITKNWRAAAEIEPGDWLVAYLCPKRVFAIGEVIQRRHRSRHREQQRHEDTIERATNERSHRYLHGVVDYTDARALYEDFTDTWNLRVTNPRSKGAETWRYPQRIDVAEWLHVVQAGIQVEGPWTNVPPYKIQLAVFQIPDSFFERIRRALKEAAV